MGIIITEGKYLHILIYSFKEIQQINYFQPIFFHRLKYLIMN